MKWFSDKKKKEEENVTINKEPEIKSSSVTQQDVIPENGNDVENIGALKDKFEQIVQSDSATRETITDDASSRLRTFGKDDDNNTTEAQNNKREFGDVEVQKVIEILMTSMEDNVIPAVNFEENRWSYPLLDKLGRPEHVSALLEEISSPSVNILEKGEYERIPVCPKHPQYLSTSMKLYCSGCSSTDVVKLHLIEHKPCGYITTKIGFGEVSTGINSCASCKKKIRDPENELRKLGRWYECNNCKIRFDDLVTRLHCRKFDHDFEINQADIVIVPYYKLKADAKSVSIYAYSLIPQLQKLSVLNGFTIESSTSVKGKSGVMHKTSLFASNRENKSVLIDIKSGESELGDAEINSMLVKVLDISPSVAVFIGVPEVSETAKALAKAHKISVVTGKDFDEIIKSTEQILKNRLYLENKMDKNAE